MDIMKDFEVATHHVLCAKNFDGSRAREYHLVFLPCDVREFLGRGATGQGTQAVGLEEEGVGNETDDAQA